MAFGLASHDANVQGTRAVCGLSSASENSNSRCLESVRVWIMHGDLCVRESFLVHILPFFCPPFHFVGSLGVGLALIGQKKGRVE